jgi:gamma-glutamylcyclotransferase (GGCT)/AIG2-like uncharacterized protein YtfP
VDNIDHYSCLYGDYDDSDFEDNLQHELIFVYGSLRRGRHNHQLIKDCEFIQYDSITAKDISTPQLAACIHGEGTVQGEVYSIDPLTMIYVDRLEGIDWHFYTKEQVTTHKGLEVSVYFLNWSLPVAGFPHISDED